MCLYVIFVKLHHCVTPCTGFKL